MRIGILLIALVTSIGQLTAQSIIRGPYLQNPTKSRIKVMWRTDVATDSKVYYGTDMNNLSESVEDANSVTDHNVEISGLDPFTKYYYSVGTTSQVLSGPVEKHHFTTSPAPGTQQKVRVWAIGDFGKANTEERAVMDSYIAYNQDTLTNVWIWLGDNAYDSGLDQEYQAKVYDTAFYGKVMTYMPFMPCPGNHDYESVSPPQSTVDPNNHSGAYYDMIDVPTNGEAGGLASGKELYYSFDYGNVHFLSLNSELGSVITPGHDWTGANLFGSFNGSPFTEWIEQDLAANTQPWIIAYFHQPAHTAGSHNSADAWEAYMKAMRENINPILEEYGVDIIINGHSHVYERSYLIKDFFGVPNEWDSAQYVLDGSSGNDAEGKAYVKNLTGPNANQGTVYVVQGNSASKTTDPPLDHPAMYFGHGCSECVGSTIIEVEGKKLRSRYLTSEGEILDDFTIYKPDLNVSAPNTQPLLTEVQTYPNPFIEKTVVNYALAKKTEVTIELFDITGKSIAMLYRGTKDSGSHQITVDGDKLNLAKGPYLIKFSSKEGEHLEKIVKLN